MITGKFMGGVAFNATPAKAECPTGSIKTFTNISIDIPAGVNIIKLELTDPIYRNFKDYKTHKLYTYVKISGRSLRFSLYLYTDEDQFGGIPPVEAIKLADKFSINAVYQSKSEQGLMMHDNIILSNQSVAITISWSPDINKQTPQYTI
jgi:hypothetical protein